MPAKRDYYLYSIRTLRNRILYFGITKNPVDRLRTHIRNRLGGGQPIKMRRESPKVTKRTALKREDARIRAYRRRNGPDSLLNKLPKR